MSTSNLSRLINELNPAQKAAVTAPLETMMIIAGAGSGKTRVVTTRIAYLIEEYGIPPHEIVALTFTNKAGREMQERISHLLPNLESRPYIGTFHSYCLTILKKSKTTPFTIIDADDQRTLLKKILKRFGLEKEITPARMQGLISFHKNHLPEHHLTATPPVAFFTDVYLAYEHEKRESLVLDFDDLLIETLALLKQHNPLQSYLPTDSIRHIFVDEYQDTNQVQHALLLELHKKAESICVVGDEDQSIYSWRGAQADNMHRFIATCKPHVFKIEQNYRSVQPILEIANQVISNNKGRNDKKLWSDKQAERRVLSVECQSSSVEGHLIAEAASAVFKAGKSLANFAVLYRTHQQSRLIEEALIQRGVPYVIIGGTRFYERKEIKDILAYLKLLVNPHDRVSLLRVINVPGRGFGEKFQEQLEEFWKNNTKMTFRELLTSYASTLGGAKETAITQFIEIFSRLTRDMQSVSLSSATTSLIDIINYRGYLLKEYEQIDADSRFENVKELVAALNTYEENKGIAQTDESSTQLSRLEILASFIDDVALMQEQSDDTTGTTPPLSLMTLHAAKGLEFDTVILSGLEETILPSSRALMNTADLEEERRLCYVGITRAREHLLLTHSKLRITYNTPQIQQPSRFLDEMPEQHVETALCDTAYNLPPALFRFLGLSQPQSRVFTPSHFARSSTSEKPYVAITREMPTSLSSTATATPKPRSPYSVGSKVVHPTFGVGTIQEVAQQREETYLTIAFTKNHGTKKIAARFIQPLKGAYSLQKKEQY